jgi:hypothetical protein
MSDAKRDHSAFRRTAAANQAATPRTHAAVPPPTLKLQTLKLAVIEVAPPWGSVAAAGGDPYNAVGPRATVTTGRR